MDDQADRRFQGFDLQIDGHRNLYSGFLIARLRIEGNDPAVRERAMQQLVEAASAAAGSPVTCSWLIESVAPYAADRMETALAVEERPRLSQVARVDLRHHPEQLAGTLAALRANEELVDLAYAELAVTFEPSTVAEARLAKARFTAQDQGYLDDAPEGIGARGAWSLVDLSRCRLIDVESAWSRAHEDIDNGKLTLLNTMRPSCKRCVNHGLSVLGVVVAKPGAPGGTGVAFATAEVGLISTWSPSLGSDLYVADAIILASNTWAGSGDANVVLVEVQRGSPLQPAEVDWADWQAIHLAVASGLAVVECAGNGGTRIEGLAPGEQLPPHQVLRRAHDVKGHDVIEILDSGAVMVGAGKHKVQRGCHQRTADSNFGTRIDCYAWGDSIYTTGQEDLGPNLERSYREEFGGTSGAAAIVAGAALLVQGRRKKLSRPFLSPADLRALLQSHGTCQLNPQDGLIGKMPDLTKIFPRL